MRFFWRTVGLWTVPFLVNLHLHGCLNLPFIHLHVLGFKGRNWTEVKNHSGANACSWKWCLHVPDNLSSKHLQLSHVNTIKKSKPNPENSDLLTYTMVTSIRSIVGIMMHAPTAHFRKLLAANLGAQQTVGFLSLHVASLSCAAAHTLAIWITIWIMSVFHHGMDLTTIQSWHSRFNSCTNSSCGSRYWSINPSTQAGKLLEKGVNY